MSSSALPRWTKGQRTSFLIASSTAGWNDEQRYAVMRYAGCPIDLKEQRPSVTHPKNSGEHHRYCMAVAESACKSERISIRPPRNHASWNELANVKIARERELAKEIAREAIQKMPRRFRDGLLEYAVRHVADQSSNPLLPGVKPESIEQCDGPTTHRVVECLRQYVGRVFMECGVSASAFRIPAGAIKRAERECQKRSIEVRNSA